MLTCASSTLNFLGQSSSLALEGDRSHQALNFGSFGLVWFAVLAWDLAANNILSDIILLREVLTVRH